MREPRGPYGLHADQLKPMNHLGGVDTRPDAIMVGIKRYPVRGVHLVYPADRESLANHIVACLEQLQIRAHAHAAERANMNGLLDMITDILQGVPGGEAVVNLSSGWEEYSFAALTASFLTGTPAFAVQGENVVPVPVLRVRYPDVISPAKMSILRELRTAKRPVQVKELAGSVGLGPSLVSYHLRGYRDRAGLEEMGLVEAVPTDRRGHAVRLTTLGRCLLATSGRRDGRDGAGSVAPSERPRRVAEGSR